MAITINEIKIKRGPKANVVSATLSKGEPVVSMDTKELYVGDGMGMIKISDALFFDSLATFPATGQDGKLYIDKSTAILYVWDGSGYAYRITTGSPDEHSIGSHTDFNETTIPGLGQVVTWNGTQYEPQDLPAAPSEPDPPPTPDPGQPWYDPDEGMQFLWDETRSKWLTIARSPYMFNRDGFCRNIYIPTSGLFSVDFYYIPRDACITSIYCRVASVDRPNKSIYIRANGANLTSFNLGSSTIYENRYANVDLNSGDIIQIWVPKDPLNSRILDPMVQLEIAWRKAI